MTKILDVINIRVGECIYTQVVDKPTRNPPANEHAINMFSSKNACTCKCSKHTQNYWNNTPL